MASIWPFDQRRPVDQVFCLGQAGGTGVASLFGEGGGGVVMCAPPSPPSTGASACTACPAGSYSASTGEEGMTGEGAGSNEGGRKERGIERVFQADGHVPQ